MELFIAYVVLLVGMACLGWFFGYQTGKLKGKWEEMNRTGERIQS
jgi:hypothetical protein